MSNVTNIRRGPKNAYRQVRLTYTEESSGRTSYSVHVKPLNAPWTQQTCVVRDYIHQGRHAESMEEVYQVLEFIASTLRWSPPAE